MNYLVNCQRSRVKLHFGAQLIVCDCLQSFSYCFLTSYYTAWYMPTWRRVTIIPPGQKGVVLIVFHQ